VRPFLMRRLKKEVAPERVLIQIEKELEEET
jgi:hypothetical protein